MTDISTDIDWLNFKDTNEVHWAIQYLLKSNTPNSSWLTRVKPSEFSQHLQSYLRSITQTHTLENKNLLRKMKAAKSQRDNRKKRKRASQKAYSFVMSVNIQSKLKKLAGQRTFSEVVEKLIIDAIDNENNLKQEQKVIKESLPNNPLKERIKKLESVENQLKYIIYRLLKENSTLEYKLQILPNDTMIFEKDKKQINLMYRNKIKEVNSTYTHYLLDEKDAYEIRDES